MANILKYHQEIFNLLRIEAKIDTERFALLDHLEAKYHFILPLSIKEYFSIDILNKVLKEYKVFDDIIELEEFATAEHFEGLSAEDLDLLKVRKIMPLFSERKGNWTWFLNLKAALEDPKVLLHTQDFPDLLASHPHKFSKQLYLNFWDNYVIRPRNDGFYLSTTERTVRKDVLYDLRNYLHEITTSYVMIVNETTYRFQRNRVFIAIIDNGIESVWYFHATEIEDLKTLLEVIKKSSLLNLVLKPVEIAEKEADMNLERVVVAQLLNKM